MPCKEFAHFSFSTMSSYWCGWKNLWQLMPWTVEVAKWLPKVCGTAGRGAKCDPMGSLSMGTAGICPLLGLGLPRTSSASGLGTTRWHLMAPSVPLCWEKPSQEVSHPSGWFPDAMEMLQSSLIIQKSFPTLKGELCHAVYAKGENNTGMARGVTHKEATGDKIVITGVSAEKPTWKRRKISSGVQFGWFSTTCHNQSQSLTQRGKVD